MCTIIITLTHRYNKLNNILFDKVIQTSIKSILVVHFSDLSLKKENYI